MKEMFKLLIATVLLGVTGCQKAQVSVEEHQDAYALENSADIVIDYSPGGDEKHMEIYLRSLDGKISDNPDRTALFIPDSLPLKNYLEAMRHKDLIVVIFEKTELEDATLDAEALALRDYFISCGFNRIAVQAQTGGNSRPIYLDYKK